MFGVVNAINVWGAHRMWEGRQPSFFDGPKPRALFGGDITWRGMGRIYPLMTAWGYLCGVPIGFAFAIPERGEGLLFWVPAVTGAVALPVTLVLVTTVHFFNTPKWMVPPHRRAEPGAIREWRDTRRARRQARSTEESRQEPKPRA